MKEVKRSKLDDEIKELEELAFGTKEDGKEVEESAETPDTDKPEATTESTEVETAPPAEAPPTPEKKNERNWETEYKQLRASTDTYKFTIRQELAALKERLVASDAEVRRLRESIVVPKEDLFKDTFSKEDVEAVGEDALQMMQKAATTAAEAQTKPLQEELDRERQLRLDAEKRSITVDKSKAVGIFLDKLESVVPDYQDINYDKAFEIFIKQADPINGGSRLTHLKNAERTGNVATVAAYMNEFKALKGTQDSLAERVAPTGKPVADTGVEGKVALIPESDIKKFYDDISKGKYKGKQSLQKELEDKYDKAFSTGAIDYMR